MPHVHMKWAVRFSGAISGAQFIGPNGRSKYMPICSQCATDKQKKEFSNSQLKKRDLRRCSLSML